jgi:hypothetical protein
LNSKKEVLFSLLAAFVAVSIVSLLLRSQDPKSEVLVTILSLLLAIVLGVIWNIPDYKPLAAGLFVGILILMGITIYIKGMYFGISFEQLFEMLTISFYKSVIVAVLLVLGYFAWENLKKK